MCRLVEARVQRRIDGHADEVPTVISCLILDGEWPRADVEKSLDNGQRERRGEYCLAEEGFVGFNDGGPVSAACPGSSLDDDCDDCPE